MPIFDNSMPKVGIIFYTMTEKDSPTASTSNGRKNWRILLTGATAIILLTFAGIGILHYSYTKRMENIHQSNRKLPELNYAGKRYDPPSSTREKTYEKEFNDTDELSHPVFQRMESHEVTTGQDSTKEQKEHVEEAMVQTDTSTKHLTLCGNINNDEMLFVLEESSNGQLKGQFYNKSLNKAFSVEGRHQGKKILLKSTSVGKWDFTIVEENGGYKGVATDGQFTYHLKMEVN